MSKSAQKPLLGDGDKAAPQMAESYKAATGGEKARFDKEVDDVKITQPLAKGDDYIGLSKDELEQYANDPFWRTLRYILFILFWLAWIAMFAAAVVIVIMSPKCPEVVVPQWWQRKVCYQAWTPSLADSDGDGVGDLNGITNHIDDLRRIGVQSVRVHPLIKHGVDTTDAYDVVNFDVIEESAGTMEDFAAFVKAAHANSMFVVIDLPLTVTSPTHQWFTEHADYYVWRDNLTGVGAAKDKFWAKAANGKYYLKHEDRSYPVLNWNHQPLVTRMNEVMNSWLEKGVDGFFLPFVEYLARGSDGTKADYARIANRLSAIRESVNSVNRTTPVLLYSTAEHLTHDQKMPLINDGKLNYILNTDLIFKDEECNTVRAAACIYNKLGEANLHHQQFNESFPMWEIGGPLHSRIATRTKSNATAELWTMMLLSLPGSLNTYYGEEIGMSDVASSAAPHAYRSAMQWSDEKNAGFSEADDPKVPINDDYTTVNFHKEYYTPGTSLKMFRRLAKMRQIDEVFMSGDFVLSKSAPKDNVLVFSRIARLDGDKLGRVYYTALNFGDETVTVNADDAVLPGAVQREKGITITVTSNMYGEYYPRKDIDIKEGLTLAPKQGIVIRFN